MAVAAVELVGLCKRFGELAANDGIHVRVERGSIHGIVGENGAGKSTAMKMLYGLYAPDSGEIRVRGEVRKFRSPRDAIAAGIGMVHQHFMLSEPHTALDNILLGAVSAKKLFLPMDRTGARKRLSALAHQYGLDVPLDTPVNLLPVGVQQRIEILKLLNHDAQILILDEPTAVLTPQETEGLFTNLKKLRSEGKTILIITHKLKEVMSFTDRVTVFRAGHVTGEVETRDTSPQKLADLMVGRSVNLKIQVNPPQATGDVLLRVSDLYLGPAMGSNRPRLNHLNFQVKRGEILGVAGVEGNGQSELLQALLHPSEHQSRSSGKVQFFGKDVSHAATAEIKGMGVGVIPEDRHRDGLLLESTLDENFFLGLHRSFFRDKWGWISHVRLKDATRKAMEEYDVRPRDISTHVGRLSGGNQQKLIIAREFERKPRFLIAAQPTRGVDVGAIELIHKRIVRARDEGAGVLLVSSELDEVIALSDRILIMYEGKIVGETKRGELGEREIGLLMGGGRHEASV